METIKCELPDGTKRVPEVWDADHPQHQWYLSVVDQVASLCGGNMSRVYDLINRIQWKLEDRFDEDDDDDDYKHYSVERINGKDYKPATVASSMEILKKLYPQDSINHFYGLSAWLPKKSEPGTLFGLDRSTVPLRPMMIGTGPWPDDEDTGDPDDCPSTQPMGYYSSPTTVPVTPPKPAVSPSVSLNDGMHCKKCNEKNDYADPNQPDGTYVCYGCRT